MNHELLMFQMVGGHACSYQKLVPLNFVESQNMGYCYYKLVRISFQRLSKQFRFFCFNLTNESLGNIFKKFLCQKSLLFCFYALIPYKLNNIMRYFESGSYLELIISRKLFDYNKDTLINSQTS